MLLSLIAILLTVNPPDAGGSQQPFCPTIRDAEFFFWWNLGQSFAKEGPPPGGTAKLFFTGKEHWLRDCPHNETVWYSILRAAELTSQGQKAPSDLIEAARAAVPNAVWIETVRARALGTVEAAEAAVRLDPKHIPAQVALAAAHEHMGDHAAAVRILRPIRELDRVVGGPLLLAQAAFALGDFELAAASARREPDREGLLIEPVSSMLMIGEARVLEGDARLKLGQADKAVSAFYEADFWRSLEGWKRLCSPPVDLERAMEARLKCRSPGPWGQGTAFSPGSWGHPIARVMGPGSRVIGPWIARVMGPVDRQGHGATP
jgi:tetratricopeptide (TPR) repeat protein